MQDTKWKRIRSNHLEYVLKKINKLLHALEFQRIKHQNFDFFRLDSILVGLPRWLSGKEFGCHCRRCRFNPCVGKIPWKGKWLPTPVFLPGKTHGERSLAGYTPQGFKESDTTEWLNHHHPLGVTRRAPASHKEQPTLTYGLLSWNTDDWDSWGVGRPEGGFPEAQMYQSIREHVQNPKFTKSPVWGAELPDGPGDREERRRSWLSWEGPVFPF